MEAGSSRKRQKKIPFLCTEIFIQILSYTSFILQYLMSNLKPAPSHSHFKSAPQRSFTVQIILAVLSPSRPGFTASYPAILQQSQVWFTLWLQNTQTSKSSLQSHFQHLVLPTPTSSRHYSGFQHILLHEVQKWSLPAHHTQITVEVSSTVIKFLNFSLLFTISCLKKTRTMLFHSLKVEDTFFK